MKATIDVPDELYRRVKAQSALRAQTVREVTVALYRGWLAADAETDAPQAPVETAATPAWFGAAAKYARRIENDDMASVRKSIADGRTAAGDHA